MEDERLLLLRSRNNKLFSKVISEQIKFTRGKTSQRRVERRVVGGEIFIDLHGCCTVFSQFFSAPTSILLKIHAGEYITLQESIFD